MLLDVTGVSPSSYYYERKALKKPDKYACLRPLIRAISDSSNQTYGSPRIWIYLRRRGIYVSEKVIRRLMKEEKIVVHYATRKRKYSSYIGEITPAVENKVRGNFHASSPNTLWLTDITEFSVCGTKVYLSPMIDCFDGQVVAWETSRHPDSMLVSSMLEKAIKTVSEKKREEPTNRQTALTIHTDRGGHYRGGEWIERLDGLGITRSMSRKGNSGDNAACEGFFGRMKTEMFYGRKWTSPEELERAIANYIFFYNNERIRISLGGMSIREYREQLEKVSK